MISFGARKYLWGNMPSIDIVKLDDNEGSTCEMDLKILFAGKFPYWHHLLDGSLTGRTASGDPRNVVKTIASLPHSYIGKPSVVINDIDFDIVARNVVMLLLTLTTADDQAAAETVLHVWYSAFIRPIDFQRLESLRPLIEDVCHKIAGRGAGSLQAKTFTIGSCSLRVVLKKEQWTALLTYLGVPKGLTTKQAHSVRVAVTQAPHRVDFRHRELALQQPEHRVCKEKFREDAILVPFGHSREEFTTPNP